MTNTFLAIGKTKLSTPDWPVDLPALWRQIGGKDAHFRMAVMAAVLQEQGLPAEAKACQTMWTAYQAESLAMDWSQSRTLVGLRINNSLWQPNGARRWEDAFFARPLDFIPSHEDGVAMCFTVLSETPLPQPKKTQQWGQSEVLEKAAQIGTVPLRNPLKLELEHHNTETESSLKDFTRQPIWNARLFPPTPKRKLWTAMGQEEGKLAFFQWTSHEKNALLHRQWLEQQMDSDQPTIRRPRL